MDLAKSNNIIHFEQNGNFYYKLAQKHIEKEEYIEALNCYRKAVDREPRNLAYVLELAELMTEMNFFDESNALLAYSLHYAGEYAARLYFDMAFNFLGSQDYDQAREYFARYIEIEPDGDYADEAEEFLAILELQSSYIEEMMDQDSGFKALYKRARLGKQLLDKGEYKKAIKVFEHVLEEDPTLLFIRNNLSLAYFCTGDVEKAIEIEESVLLAQSDNVHANCNMALYYDEIGDAKATKEYIDKIIGLIDADDPDALCKIGLTMCELGQHEYVLKVLNMLLEYNPYDIKMLHYCGIACLNLEQYNKAAQWWIKVLRLDPDSSVALFYRQRANMHEQGLLPAGQYLYQYQVTKEEFLRRMDFINEILSFAPDKLRYLWNNDPEFYDIITWGLDINDDMIKSILLHIIAEFKDDKAEKILREFLLRRGESERLRQEIFALLKQNDVKEPYMAYIDQRLVEVKVNIVPDGKNVCEAYREAAELAAKIMCKRLGCEDDCAQDMRQIMEDYLRSVSDGELVNIRKKEVWAAALEYFYCKHKKKIKVCMADVADRYGVSVSALSGAYRRLTQALGGV